MAQITTGLRSVLSHSHIYDLMQNIMGAQSFRKYFVATYIRPMSGDRVLDLGCGTADILGFLPDVEYHGYDISSQYISSAKKKYGNRGAFHQEIFTEEMAAQKEKFNVSLAMGVLHHLDDETAHSLLRTAHASLHRGGRFVSHDPVFVDGQNPIARFLISKDRGQNVRTQSEYVNLVKDVFPSFSSQTRDQSWIPYTHCFLNAEKK